MISVNQYYIKMNYHKELSVYRWTALALVFLILLVFASGGVSVIWMRQKISHTAESNAKVERSIAEIDRKTARLDEQIARVHNPIYLMSRAKNGLRPTNEREQVVWMGPLGQPDSNPVSTASEDPKSPLTISFDLALLDPNEGTRRNQ